MADAGRDDDRLAGPGHECLAVQGEMGFGRGDDEPFLLAGVDVLGDQAAGHAAPVEADELPVAVFGDGRVLDPLARRGVEEGPEAGHHSAVGPVRRLASS
jgi:hypothetical protein